MYVHTYVCTYVDTHIKNKDIRTYTYICEIIAFHMQMSIKFYIIEFITQDPCPNIYGENGVCPMRGGKHIAYVYNMIIVHTYVQIVIDITYFIFRRFSCGL